VTIAPGHPVIVAFVGLSGVGKTEATDIADALLSPVRFYFGGVVLNEVRKRGLDTTPENEARVREELRAEHGMAAMAKLLLPDIRTALDEERPVLIDGLYSYAELKLLREAFGAALVTIAIHSRKTIRAERLATRSVRPLTFAEMIERDRREVEALEKAQPIALADYHVINEGSVDDLRADISAIVDTIIAMEHLAAH
jgi:dephospho-CoA kinase